MKEKGPTTGLLESSPFGRCLWGVLMGTLVDSQRPWLWTQGWSPVTFLSLSLVVCPRAFYWGLRPCCGLLQHSLAHGTLTVLALAMGRLLSTKSCLLAWVCCVSASNLLSFVNQPHDHEYHQKRMPCCPRVLPLLSNPKIALDSVILHLCEDIVRCKCLPQLLPGTSNLCKYFSWLHSLSPPRHELLKESVPELGRIWNKISF